jgi:hypothetical protein
MLCQESMEHQIARQHASSDGASQGALIVLSLPKLTWTHALVSPVALPTLAWRKSLCEPVLRLFTFFVCF